MTMREIVGKLIDMNNANNLTDDNLRPVVEYQVTDHYSKPMMQVASKLKALGMDNEAERVIKQINLINSGSKEMLNELGRENVKRAEKIERGMVGHGRSGYIPTGNLMRSIKSHTLTDGRVQVYPEATTKKGTEYGGFVEYGTRKHPTPEPFMYQSNKEMKSVIDREISDLMKGAGF